MNLLPPNVKLDLNPKDLVDMRIQGRKLSTEAIPGLKREFGEFELLSTEEKLYEPITEYTDKEYNFKGFIDVVLKQPDGRICIIDWKTCSWGWNARRKAEPITNYQLTLYKHFYCQKHNIDPKNVDTYFALLKRTAKSNNVEIFKVTSGEKKIKNSLNLLTKALYNIDNKRFIKNRLSCKYCEFYNTEYCT